MKLSRSNQGGINRLLYLLGRIKGSNEDYILFGALSYYITITNNPYLVQLIFG